VKAVHTLPLAAAALWLLVISTAVAEAQTHDVLVSLTADRAGALPLAGRSVTGTIYVFVGPATGITRVRFFLDDPQPIHRVPCGQAGARGFW
jgi:hypothetical protein